MTLTKQIQDWWGNFHFDINQCAQWEIGTLRVWVLRKEFEWRIGYENDETLNENTVEVMKSSKEIHLEEFPNIKRYVFKKTDENLQILPKLADRSVVTKPITPFYIAPNEETVVFVSSPLWVSIKQNDTKTFTEEFPIERPSDTWFGPDTLKGEVCYASQTSCRLYLDDFPYLPDRAITPLTIKNVANTPLLIERINLPVKYLSLYKTENGYLWTQALNMKCEDDGTTVSIKISKHLPTYSGKASLVSTEREKAGNN
ncbi:MAG: hypothetical protein HQK84_02590, partial [Nitrospinae bacterium]|nr:hypothetical protein [Nitrospinota bacterium]